MLTNYSKRKEFQHEDIAITKHTLNFLMIPM